MKILKTMIGLSVLGICFCPQFTEAKNAPEDLYMQIYESFNELEPKALEHTAKQMGVSQKDISEVLAENFSSSFLSACRSFFKTNSDQQANTYQCYQAVKENYEYEKKLVEFENKLFREASTSEIWSDGDLNNGFFDLATDFSIIEAILFGENTYEYPYAGGNDNKKSDNKGGGEDTKTDLKGLIENLRDNEDSSDSDNNSKVNVETTVNDLEKTPAKTTDISSNNTNYSPLCVVKTEPPKICSGNCKDPEEIIVDDNFWCPDTLVDNQAFTESSVNIAKNGISATPASWDNFQGGDFGFSSSDIDGTTNGSSNSGGDGGNTIFNGLLTLDAWPCSGPFCVKMGTQPQKIGGGGNSAVSVQEIVDTGNEQLAYLKGYNLTVHKNSNERYMLSVGKFLSRMINIDVITQGIPVKSNPDRSSEFDDPNPNDAESDETTLLNQLKTKIGEASSCILEENKDLTCNQAGEANINLRSGKEELPDDTYSKLNEDSEFLKELMDKTRKDFVEEHKIQYSQGEWDDLQKQLNIMVNYFTAITEVLAKLPVEGQEILDDVKQSCNSKDY